MSNGCYDPPGLRLPFTSLLYIKIGVDDFFIYTFILRNQDLSFGIFAEISKQPVNKCSQISLINLVFKDYFLHVAESALIV